MSLDLPAAPAWHEHASCIGHLPELWDDREGSGPPTPEDIQRAELAHAICAGCPVAIQCLTDALDYESGDRQMRSTIRGGLTPEQRARLASGAA